MSRYVSIRSFAGDWNNHSHGRKVKCPRCGDSFTAFVRINDAVCGCGAQIKVLTDTPKAIRKFSQGGNAPQKPRPVALSQQAVLPQHDPTAGTASITPQLDQTNLQEPAS